MEDRGHIPVECRRCSAREGCVLYALPAKLLAEVRSNARFHLLAKGVTVVDQGEPAKWAAIVRRGVLRLYRTNADGRVRTFGYATPGDVIGLVEILSGEPFPFSIESEDDGELELLPRTDLVPLLFESPELARGLLIHLAESTADLMRRFGRRMEDRSPRARLVHALWRRLLCTWFDEELEALCGAARGRLLPATSGSEARGAGEGRAAASQGGRAAGTDFDGFSGSGIGRGTGVVHRGGESSSGRRTGSGSRR